MPNAILIIKHSESGYGAFRSNDGIKAVGRFSTKAKANTFLKKIAKAAGFDVNNGSLETEEALFQIVSVDVDTLPLDPEPDLSMYE